MSEKDLINLIKDGNDLYFTELMGRFSNLVKKVISRLIKDPEIVEELTQEVFLKIYNTIERFDTEYRFSGWIGIIARNTAIDYLRKNNRYDHVYFEDYPGYDFNISSQNEDNVFQFMEKKQLSSFIKKRISELPVKYRKVLDLRYYEDKTYEEIASLIEKPMGTVKNRIFRAKELLKEKLMKPQHHCYIKEMIA